MVFSSKRIWLGLLVTGSFLLWFTEISPMGHAFDVAFSNLLFNQSTQTFALPHSGWVERIGHNWMQQLLRLILVFALIQLVYAGYLKISNRFDTKHVDAFRRWLALFVACVLVSLLIQQIKKSTNIACPWNLSQFGGSWLYAGLFDAKPWGVHKMACWPAGFGASGFTLLSFAFVGGWPPSLWRLQRPQPSYLSRKSFVWYALIAGTLFGAVRILQGGHFLSHQLWALWWVVFLHMILYQVKLFKKQWLVNE